MNIKKYFKILEYKTEKINKRAKNPFLEKNFQYNPFISAIEQSYVWIEQKPKAD